MLHFPFFHFSSSCVPSRSILQPVGITRQSTEHATVWQLVNTYMYHHTIHLHHSFIGEQEQLYCRKNSHVVSDKLLNVLIPFQCLLILMWLQAHGTGQNHWRKKCLISETLIITKRLNTGTSFFRECKGKGRMISPTERNWALCFRGVQWREAN